MKPFKFALVACSKTKAPESRRAFEMYQGALFKLSYALACREAERVLILSAKHGVLEHDKWIDPYEEPMPRERHLRAIWGENVAKQLVTTFGIKNRSSVAEGRLVGRGVLCLAPQSYVESIGHMYGIREWARPLKGMGIGQQKAWLQNRLAEVMQPTPKALHEMILAFNAEFPGDADADVMVPGAIWGTWVSAAQRSKDGAR